MSELEEKINSILSSPEEMEKIAQLAKSFMGGTEGDGDKKTNTDGNALNDILGGILGKKSTGDSAAGASPLGDIDPKMLALMGKILSGSGSGGGGNGVISALLPYFSEKRRTKLEKAMRMAKMVKIAETVFAERGGGGLFGL